MTERDTLQDYDQALARVRIAQQKLAEALAAPHPADARADIVDAARMLMHDMDGLYMTTFSHMIEQINSMQDRRWSELASESKTILERQGRHAGKIAALEAKMDDMRRLLELDPPAV